MSSGPLISSSLDNPSSANSYSAPSYSSGASTKVPVLNKGVKRPRLKEKHVLTLVARRYGSLTDFSKVVARYCDIARATGVKKDTVRNVILRFHKNGNRFIPVNG